MNTIHVVYYAHSGGNGNDEPNYCRPTPFFDECSRATTLSHVDIAFVNKKSGSVELIAEIEESNAEPKKIIGDVGNLILSERMRIKEKDCLYGDLIIILGVKAMMDSEEKTKRICHKLSKINEEVGNKKIEIIPVFDNDLEILMKKIKREINQRLPINYTCLAGLVLK